MSVACFFCLTLPLRKNRLGSKRKAINIYFLIMKWFEVLHRYIVSLFAEDVINIFIACYNYDDTDEVTNDIRCLQQSPKGQTALGHNIILYTGLWQETVKSVMLRYQQKHY